MPTLREGIAPDGACAWRRGDVREKRGAGCFARARRARPLAVAPGVQWPLRRARCPMRRTAFVVWALVLMQLVGCGRGQTDPVATTAPASTTRPGTSANELPPPAAEPTGWNSPFGGPRPREEISLAQRMFVPPGPRPAGIRVCHARVLDVTTMESSTWNDFLLVGYEVLAWEGPPNWDRFIAVVPRPGVERPGFTLRVGNVQAFVVGDVHRLEVTERLPAGWEAIGREFDWPILRCFACLRADVAPDASMTTQPSATPDSRPTKAGQ
jgi:hypothetical protein